MCDIPILTVKRRAFDKKAVTNDCGPEALRITSRHLIRFPLVLAFVYWTEKAGGLLEFEITPAWTPVSRHTGEGKISSEYGGGVGGMPQVGSGHQLQRALEHHISAEKCTGGYRNSEIWDVTDNMIPWHFGTKGGSGGARGCENSSVHISRPPPNETVPSATQNCLIVPSINGGV